LKVVDQAKGRFRSFLLAAFEHFLCNEHDREHALKRGGGREQFSLDFHNAEGRYHLEPADRQTPQKIYERRWALTLLDRVLQRLQDEHEKAGKGRAFAHLKGYLLEAADAAPYTAVAADLGISEAAVKMAVHRLRKRYRQLLREEIAVTVDDPADVGEE